MGSRSEDTIQEALAANPTLGLHVREFIESQVWMTAAKKKKSSVKRVCRSKTHIKAIGPSQWAEWYAAFSHNEVATSCCMALYKRYTTFFTQAYVFDWPGAW